MYTHSTVKKTWGQNLQNFVQLSTLSPTFRFEMSAIYYLPSIFSLPAAVRLNCILCIAPSIDLFSLYVLFSKWRSQGNLPRESFPKLRVHMLMNMEKFETNSFLEKYHLTCIGKTKQKLRRSVSCSLTLKALQLETSVTEQTIKAKL